MANGAKGRKIGRNKNKPANKRYLAEQRWLKNKRKRIAAQERFITAKGVLA